MNTLQEIFIFIKRRKKTTFFLLLYYLWWIFCFYFVLKVQDNPNRSCGAANGALVIYTILILIIYFVVSTVYSNSKETQKSEDFKLVLKILFWPIFFALIGIVI